MNTYNLTLVDLDINPDTVKAYKDFYYSMEDECNLAALESGMVHYLCFLGDRYIITNVPTGEVEYTSVV